MPFRWVLNDILRISLCLSLVFFPCGSFGDSFYVVQKNDTLSSILHRLKRVPIYGESGSLRQVLNSNPDIAARPNGGNLIFPGEKIKLDEMQARKAETEPSVEVPSARTLASEPADPEFSDFSVQFDQAFLRIDGHEDNGTQGVLASGMSPSLQLEWSPHFNEDSWIDLGFQYQWVSVTDTSNRTLQDRDQTLGRYFVGFHHRLTSRFQIAIQAAMEEALFHRAISSSVLKIDKVAVPEFQLGVSEDLYHSRRMSLSAEAAYRFHLGFSTDRYDGSVGSGFLGALAVEQRFGTWALFGRVYYTREHYPLQGVQFDLSELGLGLGLRFTVGEPR